MKESITIAQNLQELGILQKEDLIKEFKALLQASCIYDKEVLKCVPHIVVSPKKNDFDFKPLNDEIVVYKTGNVENVVCQEGTHVNEPKIEVIQKVTTPTSLKALKVFVLQFSKL